VLVADFGGGTSDFSVVRFEVSDTINVQALGHSGVGVAGDAFDYRIIDNAVLPYFGKGTMYRSSGGKVLEVPSGLFASFARWNHLSVLRATETFRAMKEYARASLEPQKLARCIELVEHEQGYALYKAVSDAKAELSKREQTELRVPLLDEDFTRTVTRAQFEDWIGPDLQRIKGALDEALHASGIDDSGVDRVFLTGGTSFVPAIRKLFYQRFGEDRVEGGGELLSVANGLAMIGERPDARRWAVQHRAQP
jgi:hypothetical chaperone protein